MGGVWCGVAGFGEVSLVALILGEMGRGALGSFGLGSGFLEAEGVSAQSPEGFS